MRSDNPDALSHPLQPAMLSRLSDDECLDRLASEVDAHDSDHLDEVAMLIGRLAVPIEL